MAEGVYNAVLALLDRPGDMVEYVEPFHDAYSFPKLVTKPPLWLTVVGRDDNWPLATLAVEDNGYMLY